jgi:hypothetical protein
MTSKLIGSTNRFASDSSVAFLGPSTALAALMILGQSAYTT